MKGLQQVQVAATPQGYQVGQLAHKDSILVLKLPTLPINSKPPSLIESDLIRLSSLSWMYSSHFISWWIQAPNNFSLSDDFARGDQLALPGCLDF